MGGAILLVKFTIDAGSVPVTRQAREELLDDRLRLLREYDPNAEDRARNAIRLYLRTHNEFTAAHIASPGTEMSRMRSLNLFTIR